MVQADLVREVAVEGRAARFAAKGMRHHPARCWCLRWIRVDDGQAGSYLLANIPTFGVDDAAHSLRLPGARLQCGLFTYSERLVPSPVSGMVNRYK
jgi:hypothetical protein